MSLNIDPATLAELLADPALAETVSAVAGCPLVVVSVDGPAAGRQLAGLELAATPAIVVVLAPDPAWLPADAMSAADVILTEDQDAPAPFTAPRAGPVSAVAQLEQRLATRPVAGTALALLLRSSAGLPVPAGLVAESATYSALQEGEEFRHWRAARPARSPEPGRDRVRVGRHDGEFRITLSRPARRNAVDWRMRDALFGALTAAAAEPELQVVLRGDGPDFCAGGDLDEFGSRPDPALAHLIRLTRSPALLLHRLAARTTVRLHGACLGAGIELPAFSADVRAQPGTSFGLPEIDLGLIPGSGGTVSLPRRIGRWRTAYLALTGSIIDAGQALDWGLIDAVDEDEGGLRCRA
jgi:enoyl-CoA hydratase/carnithine racemase